MEAKLQTYLQEKGVEDLLKDIVVELCKETPEDVLGFVKSYVVKRQGGEDDDGSDDEEEAAPPRRSSRRGAVSADVMDVEDIESGGKRQSLVLPAAIIQPSLPSSPLPPSAHVHMAFELPLSRPLPPFRSLCLCLQCKVWWTHSPLVPHFLSRSSRPQLSCSFSVLLLPLSVPPSFRP